MHRGEATIPYPYRINRKVWTDKSVWVAYIQLIVDINSRHCCQLSPRPFSKTIQVPHNVGIVDHPRYKIQFARWDTRMTIPVTVAILPSHCYNTILVVTRSIDHKNIPESDKMFLSSSHYIVPSKPKADSYTSRAFGNIKKTGPEFRDGKCVNNPVVSSDMKSISQWRGNTCGITDYSNFSFVKMWMKIGSLQINSTFS